MFLQASRGLLFYQCIVWEAYLNGFALLLHYTSLSLANIRVLRFLSIPADKSRCRCPGKPENIPRIDFPLRKLQYGCKWNIPCENTWLIFKMSCSTTVWKTWKVILGCAFTATLKFSNCYLIRAPRRCIRSISAWTTLTHSYKRCLTNFPPSPQFTNRCFNPRSGKHTWK